MMCRFACATVWPSIVVTLLCAGCTSDPMMPDIPHVVDRDSGAAGDRDTAVASDLGGGSAPLSGEARVRRSDTTDKSRNPFALTGKGQEIERSLGVDQ